MRPPDKTGPEEDKKVNNKRIVSPSMIITVLIVIFALIAAVIILNGQRNAMDTPSVILPSPIGGSDSPSGQESDNPGTGRKAEVTVETVQAVLGTLIRADSYSRSVSIESFWSGGSSKSDIDVWVKGPNTRIIETGEGETKNILILDKDIWIWYSGSGSYYHGQTGSGNSIDDKYQRILSYEDVISLEPEDIHEAGYTEYNGEACIYTKYTSGELGYEKAIYVSVSSGLLMGTETYDGNTLIYRMVSDAPDISTPSDDVFLSPEG
jgi:outer membrane lipoprotein-sorting protein